MSKQEEDVGVIWQIAPEQYIIGDVEQYDRHFLIRLVKFLDDKIEKLEVRNQVLKEQIKVFRVKSKTAKGKYHD